MDLQLLWKEPQRRYAFCSNKHSFAGISNKLFVSNFLYAENFNMISKWTQNKISTTIELEKWKLSLWFSNFEYPFINYDLRTCILSNECICQQLINITIIIFND